LEGEYGDKGGQYMYSIWISNRTDDDVDSAVTISAIIISVGLIYKEH